MLSGFPLSPPPHGSLLCSGSAGCMEWVSLPCANTPPRNSHAAVLDGETMIIIGGASPEGQTHEVFTIDLSNRSDLTCRRVSCQSFEPRTGGPQNSDGFEAVPTAREMHSACAYGSKGTEGTRSTTILVMGGRSATGVLRDLFSLDTGARRGDCFVKNRPRAPTAMAVWHGDAPPSGHDSLSFRRIPPGYLLVDTIS